MTKPYGLLADLHLHDWSAFKDAWPQRSDGLNPRLAALLDEIERAALEVKAAGGETLILAGDVFHVRGSVKPSVYNPTRDRLRDIVLRHGMEIVIMPGNHDLEGRESTRIGSAVTGLEFRGTGLNEDSVIRVIDEPHRSMGMGRDGHDCILVPWVENVENLKTQLDTIDQNWNGLHRSECDLILHAPIDGVIEGLPSHGLNAGYLAQLGFKRVFAGHYHNHKDFANGVYSIGALAHHTWSDVGSRAGFLIVHSDRVEYRKSHLPAFIDLSKLAAAIEEDELPLVVDKNYVRVRVEADKVKEVEAARKELLDMGAMAVVVESVPKPPVRDPSAARPTVAAGASLEVSVGDYVKVMKELGDDQARKDAVAREALDVLTAAGAEA